jgi:hypothetical protein
MEVTKWLKPSISVSRIGDSASVRPQREWNPREEPGALAAHPGICAGGEEKSLSLVRCGLLGASRIPLMDGAISWIGLSPRRSDGFTPVWNPPGAIV